MQSILTVFDAKTGELAYQDRLGEPVKEGFSSSPVAVGNKLFFTNDDGQTFVVEAGPVVQTAAHQRHGRAGPRLAGARRRRLVLANRPGTGRDPVSSVRMQIRPLDPRALRHDRYWRRPPARRAQQGHSSRRRSSGFSAIPSSGQRRARGSRIWRPTRRPRVAELARAAAGRRSSVPARRRCPARQWSAAGHDRRRREPSGQLGGLPVGVRRGRRHDRRRTGSSAATAASAYGIRVSTSKDGGRTWTTAMTPHRMRRPPSTASCRSSTRLAAASAWSWLDGREMAGGGHAAAGHARRA